MPEKRRPRQRERKARREADDLAGVDDDKVTVR
jgi:hypothetical protein